MSAGPLHPSVVLATAGVAISGFVVFVATGQDDSYISYWPAHTLAQLGEMVNYNGERVEQSSSLLHVVWLALASRATGEPVPVVGYWTGVVAGVATLLRAGVLGARLGYPTTPWLPLLLGTTAVYIYWWFGGLETAIVGWLAVEVAIVACHLASGRVRPVSVPVLAVTLGFVTVRPESSLVLGLALAAWWIVERLPGAARPAEPALARRIGGWLAVAVVCTALLAVFRWLYFDALVPQPVAAKMGGAGALERLVSGLHYTLHTGLLRPYSLPLFAGLLVLPFLALPSLRGGAVRAGERFALLFALAALGFVVTSGGDWMRGGRFFAHVAPLVAVLCLGALARGRLAPRWRTGMLGLALAANVAGLALLVAGEATGRPLWRVLRADATVRAHSPGVESDWIERANRIRTRDLLFLSEAIRVVDAILDQQPRVVIGSRQAGMVMYYLAARFHPRIEFVDLHGLTTRHLTSLRTELGLAPQSNGLAIPLDRYLDEAARREALPVPDVLFDLGVRRTPPGGGAYTVVYQQTGASPGVPLALGSRRLRVDLSVEQYLAVERELAGRVAAVPTALDWSRELARSAGWLR